MNNQIKKYKYYIAGGLIKRPGLALGISGGTSTAIHNIQKLDKFETRADTEEIVVRYS